MQISPLRSPAVGRGVHLRSPVQGLLQGGSGGLVERPLLVLQGGKVGFVGILPQLVSVVFQTGNRRMGVSFQTEIKGRC